MNLRIKKLLVKLEKENLDGLIVSFPANISYLTEYPSRDSYFLVSKEGNIYFTDSRYLEEARLALKGLAKLHKINGSVFKLISEVCLNFNLKRIGFEERNLAFAEYEKIKQGLRKKANLIPTHSLIEKLRQVKEPQEIERIKGAINITAKALNFIKNFIAPGKKELEIVAELERFIRYSGASNSAFDIIVASGPNSAFPHHISSERKLKNNEPVLVDIGVNYFGYKSDLTRTFFLGKINGYARKIYDIVLKAQSQAINRIVPGEIISKIDTAARQYIRKKGFGGFFGHSLGHGVGLEVHEEPHIKSKEDNFLEPGMVFTVEPAIYLPQRFGVRIEDMVLVSKTGCEVLSGAIHK